jgi:ATP-dependent DNA helicase RecG
VSGFAKLSQPLIVKLAKLGLHGDRDLLLHLPLRYEDETQITPLAEALPGVAVQVEVEVISSDIAFRPRRQLISRVRDANDGSGMIVVRLLNFYPSQQKQFAPGARLRLFGEIRDGYLGPEMVHPRAHAVVEEAPLPDALTPVYPTTAGLGQATLRRLIVTALQQAQQTDALVETLPEMLLKRHDLMPFAEAIQMLHQPPAALDSAALEARNQNAWRRIRFDELLAQQISLRRAYAARRTRGAPSLAARGELCGKLLEQLSFRLTAAQRRTWEEISAELASPHPMQRLLQGDVGSGKTIVAALALLQAVENGWQGALMAPTEILAEQHWHKLSAWLEPLGIEIAWLSGSLRKSQKLAALAAVGEGRAAIAVGTHALIEDEVEFARLGLAVVDEQHRFGVHQRLALRSKGSKGSKGGNYSPHQLMMSATPIPRTLAMSYYADLDVSVIDEMPPGRMPVLTKLVAENRRSEVVERIRSACRDGKQAYWVCPLIEESETLQLKTALETYERLSEELPELKIGLVHGRLKNAEKSAVMEAFVAGRVQVLVATTVIEVGVDVPNASLMVIEHAERFGLAQLHQLRGRVGRGSQESACILLYAQPLSQAGRERLKIIFENSDGFEIARQDLRLRGPGEFIGARQSGLPLLRYADLEDAALVEAARAAAEQLLRDDPAAADKHVERWLGGKQELLKA